MPRSKKSTYYFIGVLSDQSARYFVSNLRLADGFFLEVVMDGISIWGSTHKDFKRVRAQVENTLDVIVSGFAFRTRIPISYTLKNWIEAKEIIAKKNMIGWILTPLALKEHYPARSPKNTHWKKSAALYNDLYKGKGNNNHILALKDYRSAIIDKSEDAFLLAYRSVEDICRAITGCEKAENKDWQQMHRVIGTSESLIKPLNEVAKRVRHGNKSHRVVIKAKANRDKIIDIARTVIEKELKITFLNFLN